MALLYNIPLFIGIFVVLFSQARLIAFICLIWVFIYMIIISFFVKTRMLYDFEKAEADSRVSGRLADVFSNIFALKVFSAVLRFRSHSEKFSRTSQYILDTCSNSSRSISAETT